MQTALGIAVKRWKVESRLKVGIAVESRIAVESCNHTWALKSWIAVKSSNRSWKLHSHLRVEKLNHGWKLESHLSVEKLNHGWKLESHLSVEKLNRGWKLEPQLSVENNDCVVEAEITKSWIAVESWTLQSQSKIFPVHFEKRAWNPLYPSATVLYALSGNLLAIFEFGRGFYGDTYISVVSDSL